MSATSKVGHDQLLARFGVPAAAESVWRALLANPRVEVGALKVETGLTGAEIEEAIASLGDASLVRGASEPTGVVVVDPTLAIGSHLAKAERQLAEQAEEFAVLRAALPQVATVYTKARRDPGNLPGFEIVIEVRDIRENIRLAAEQVQCDIRSTEHVAASGFTDEQRALQFAVLDRGVRDRAIVRTGILSDRLVFEDFREMQDRGHEARSLANISTRLMMYDRELAVLPVDPLNMGLGAIFIRVQSVVDALILMYEHMWSIATPVFTTAPIAAVPHGRSARVLEQLGIGAKDETIARTLGVGVRTIRRDVADLKISLGVQSRGEIAAAAVRKGWL